MKIGYARVSTFDQNLFLQTGALEHSRCEKIFTDTASGSSDSRRGLIDAIEFCRSGDSLVVWKLDRLRRSLRHLIDTVNRLQTKGVEFVSTVASNVLAERISEQRIITLSQLITKATGAPASRFLGRAPDTFCKA